MKTLLLSVMLLIVTTIKAQNGNTINDAIPVNGTNIALNVLDFDSASKSNLMPECDPFEDVFYQHTVQAGDNKVTIAMASAGVILLTEFDYQILVAPAGNIANIQELNCDAYVVPILASGDFEEVIDNVVPGDVYYLRVFRPQGLGGLLSGLLSGTVITMTSEFDSTLSNPDIEQYDNPFVVSSDHIKFINSDQLLSYRIYGLDGKLVAENNKKQVIETIDISSLSKGVYVLNLRNDQMNISSKFIKQ
ncbi:MAG: T9SS type A sorting domain-containing protein [Algicola sp.]|nr:T9SS type A sorting domain-containing protein [Algicola sp.]